MFKNRKKVKQVPKTSPNKKPPQSEQPKKSRLNFKYFSTIWEGNDGKVSGKRLSGIILTGFAIHIANYGVKNCLDRIDAIIGLVGVIFATALAFWGITAVANYFQDKSGNFPTQD